MVNVLKILNSFNKFQFFYEPLDPIQTFLSQIWSRSDYELISQIVNEVLPYSHYFYRYEKAIKEVINLVQSDDDYT